MSATGGTPGVFDGRGLARSTPFEDSGRATRGLAHGVGTSRVGFRPEFRA